MKAYKITAHHPVHGIIYVIVHTSNPNHIYAEAVRQLDNITNGQGVQFKIVVEGEKKDE